VDKKCGTATLPGPGLPYQSHEPRIWQTGSSHVFFYHGHGRRLFILSWIWISHVIPITLWLWQT
jgi:hypothetical protein